jgi:hypothetical protein
MPRYKSETRSPTPALAGVPPLDRGEHQAALKELRNMSEFAELVQFLKFFRTLLKLPDIIDIDVIEEELVGITLVGETPVLDRITTAFVMFLVGMRRNLLTLLKEDGGLNKVVWHLYTNHGIAPEDNPMGHDIESVIELRSLDIPTRVTILYTFSRWIVLEDSFHDKLEKLSSEKQEIYRVDPVGWRDDFGIYYLLDDNRLYYTEMKPPNLDSVDLKTIPKSVSGGMKKNGRRKPSGTIITYQEALGRDTPYDKVKWKCVCATLPEWESFVKSLEKTRNAYLKKFYTYLKNDLFPVIEEQEEKRVKDALAREKARAKAAALAEIQKRTSSRLEARQSRIEQRQEEERQMQEEQRQRIENRRLAREKREKLVQREHRMRERDVKLEALRIKQQHQQELQQEKEQTPVSFEDSDNEDGISTPTGRKRKRVEPIISARSTRSTRSATSKPAPGGGAVEGVRKLGSPENPLSKKYFDFDCLCGVHGRNFDDGSAQVECGQCYIWFHVSCIDSAAARDDMQSTIDRANNASDKDAVHGLYRPYTWTCDRCIRKEQERIEEERKLAIKLEKQRERKERKEQKKAQLEKEKLEQNLLLEQKASKAATTNGASAALNGTNGVQKHEEKQRQQDGFVNVGIQDFESSNGSIPAIVNAEEATVKAELPIHAGSAVVKVPFATAGIIGNQGTSVRPPLQQEAYIPALSDAVTLSSASSVASGNHNVAAIANGGFIVNGVLQPGFPTSAPSYPPL